VIGALPPDSPRVKPTLVQLRLPFLDDEEVQS
jgi:hypothetical protein